ASLARSARPSEAPTAAIRPSTTATSPIASIPLAGSTTRPPEITKPLILLLPKAESQNLQRPAATPEAHPGRIKADSGTNDHLHWSRCIMLARKVRCSQDVYWVIKQRCRGNNSGDRSQMRARGLAANPNFGKVECFCGEGLTPIL